MLKIPITNFKIMSGNVITDRNVHFTILSQDIFQQRGPETDQAQKVLNFMDMLGIVLKHYCSRRHF